MIKKLTTFTLLLLLISSSAHSQGILSLLGGYSNGSKYKVKFIDGDEDAVEEILLIKIRGVIQEKDEQSEVPFKMSRDMMENLKKDLKLARKREAIKAILLDINSPGGEVTASDIIYHLIKKTKKATGKPVIAIIGSMGASGAYYIACSADKILAHPTSIIGSIGVLMQAMNVEQLAEKLGIKAVLMKSDKTPKKDLLSPFRKMTEAERAMLMEIINNVYDRFIKIVSMSRGKTIKEIENIADGGIYTADKALEIGLIDQIGYQEDAMAVACKEADIENAALVKRLTRKSFSDILSEMTAMNSGAPALFMGLEKLIEESSVPQLMFKFSLPR